MKRRIFGLESEYGVTCTRAGWPIMTPEALAGPLLEGLSPVPRSPNGFLENGARLYVDTGSHPEYATAECDDLLDLVASDRAGERMLEDLIRRTEDRLGERGLAARVQAFKNNTDSAGNSYGCHENYLVPRDTPFADLAAALIPFLVSRQVFAGAGRILSDRGEMSYSLSQRAEHIVDDLSGTTVTHRAIVNTRDEPHADGLRFRRLHLIVGDSNMSEVATYLKVGTTALVLDMIEDGFFTRGVVLESAVAALRAISRDPSLRQRVRLKNGCTYTGLEIQSIYLEACQAYARRAGTSPIGRTVLARWEDLLTRLARDPTQCPEVDWVNKKIAIDLYRERHRCSLKDRRVALIDLQYHDVRPEHGLYHLLVRRGKAETLLPDEIVERARHDPPQTTRARLRGDFVRRATERSCKYEVDWGYLRTIAPQDETVLCPDPFVAYDERVDRLAA